VRTAVGRFFVSFEVNWMGSRRTFCIYAWLVAAALCFLCAVPSRAQQKDKKKKKGAPSVVDNNSANPVVPLNDEQQIDYMISEVLGAWQIGDSERMHKNYADDVSVVKGEFAPPVLGWANYEVLYKQQRARMKQVRLDRANTYIKVNGNTAWACFQWEFAGVIDEKPSAERGQTTYIMVKRENRWLIAHDHTSVLEVAKPQSPAGTLQPAAPAKP
jgi:ketosteroid isomerase-like protein